jgi:hypothetical protein
MLPSFPSQTELVQIAETALIVYRGPVLRHSAELIQAANFRSAVAF